MLPARSCFATWALPSPRTPSVLRALVSRTSVKITAAVCPRALDRAFIVDEQRCSHPIDVVQAHVRHTRGLVVLFPVDEQRSARASVQAPASPATSDVRTRSTGQSSSASSDVPALGGSSTTRAPCPRPRTDHHRRRAGVCPRDPHARAAPEWPRALQRGIAPRALAPVALRHIEQRPRRGVPLLLHSVTFAAAWMLLSDP